MIGSVTLLDEHRCFAKGAVFELRPGVNLLVGDQGTGKSSLISLIKDMGSPHSKDRTAKVCKLSVPVACRVAHYDFEKDNLRTQAAFNIGTEMAQVQSMFLSHGQTVLGVLEAFTRDFADADQPQAVLLDEPDMALSVRSAHKLAGMLNQIAGAGHQVIAAVHNPVLIGSQPQALSLEHGRWIDSAEFLDSQKPV